MDSETKTAKVEKAKEKKGSFWSDVADMLEAVLISVFSIILVFAYILRPVTVEGHSMESTLQNKDKLIMTNFFYTPERGDIVIIDNKESWTYNTEGDLVSGESLATTGVEKHLIKRIIAVGGETLDIDFETGMLTIDGEVLEEPYINNLTLNDEGAFLYPIQIPEGYYFVMGDNRQHSSDSRHPLVGLVSEEQIMGKAVLRFSPLSNFGGIYDE